MPYIYQEPEIAFEYNGVTVYYTPRDEYSEVLSEYWYCTDPRDGFSGPTLFDIRDLDEYKKGLGFRDILREAIENGSIPRGEDET